MRTFDVHKAAAFLGVHTDTVRDGAKSGRIPGAKVGRAWVFLEADLLQYVRSLYRKAQDKEGTRWGSTAEKAPPFYWFNFRFKGQRIRESSGTADREEAEQAEAWVE